MGLIWLQHQKRGIRSLVPRWKDQIHRRRRIAARCQCQLAAQPPIHPVEMVQLGSKAVSRHIGNAVNRDKANFAFGMGIDHPQRAHGTVSAIMGHPAAARRSLIVLRGAMASVSITISIMAPAGAARARA